MNPVFLVKPDDIQDIWFGVRPIIEKALVHSEHALMSSDVLREVLNNTMQLWVGFDNNEIACVMTTEIHNYPRHKTLNVYTWSTATGHDFDIWYPEVMKCLYYYGEANNCTGLEAQCRKGLAKKLKQLDWENEYSVITRPIKCKRGE